MKTLSKSLQQNQTIIKELLPSEDIFYYPFYTENGVPCLLVYTDGVVNKEVLGDLVARPISKLNLSEKIKNGDTMSALNENSAPKNKKNDDDTQLVNLVKATLLFPELKTVTAVEDVQKEVLDGNSLLLVDGVATGFVIGAKLLPSRAVIEPPTDVTIKGPREGFVEDIKTNSALLRKRLKTPDLRLETLRVGKQSDTAVTLCYLHNIADENLKESIKSKLSEIQIDNVVDSSYLSALLSPRRHSIFRTVGTTEKPDIFAAKLCEGRIGLLVDGSPIALTLPYILAEDLQSSEDYFISAFMATIVRFLRCIALIVAILLPAFYVSTQLFKMQLLPLGLTLTIASSIQNLPLSPSLEMFVVLLLLEILKEASIRMPKYVGMSLSVVGALVLGETAVSAGFLSTPAIIIVAFSGICLYTVPNFVETGSILRWIFLLVAGSIGPFGIVLFIAFVLYYLISADTFGTPLLAPFSPLLPADLRDSFIKYNLLSLAKRPLFLKSKNKTRLRPPNQ